MRNAGYHFHEERVVVLLDRIASGDLRLPGETCRVTASTGLVEAMLTGAPIGAIVVDPYCNVVVDGARRLAALATAFQRPSDGGLSIADPTSDTPSVVAGSQPGGRTPGEYVPLAATTATMPFLHWKRQLPAMSKADMDRIEDVVAQIAGYQVPLLMLPYTVDPAEARSLWTADFRKERR